LHPRHGLLYIWLRVDLLLQKSTKIRLSKKVTLHFFLKHVGELRIISLIKGGNITKQTTIETQNKKHHTHTADTDKQPQTLTHS
jgi:hypothetical protein